MVDHRPLYHVQPAEHWMNDPNGPIHWRDQYHLFYQYNPYGPVSANKHWGHAVSRDLINWEHLPIALTPTPGGPDEGGCYSGCAVDDDGVPTIVYTGVRGEHNAEQTTCLATSGDELLTWDKDRRNPVTLPPEGLDLVGFRDPCVWREDGIWYQVVGSGIRDVGGAVFLYASDDLATWRYLGPLLTGDLRVTEPLWTGSMWECPQFFPLGDKHVLIVSVWDRHTLHYVASFVGSFADGAFVPERIERFDYGADYYAPCAMLDGHGRRLIWGWSWEGRSAEAQVDAGWAGVMSLPRVLTLDAEARLRVEPVAELEGLRAAHQRFTDLRGGGAVDGLDGVRGDCLEIVARFDPAPGVQGLRVRCSPDGEEETTISYDRERSRLVVDRTRSSLAAETAGGEHGGELTLDPDEPLELRVFLDRSIVEVYANGRACLTERIYPSRPDSLGVGLVADGTAPSATSVDVWQLRATATA